MIKLTEFENSKKRWFSFNLKSRKIIKTKKGDKLKLLNLQLIIRLHLSNKRKGEQVLAVDEIVLGDVKNVTLLQLMNLTEDLQFMTHTMNNGHILMKNFMMRNLIQFKLLINQLLLIFHPRPNSQNHAQKQEVFRFRVILKLRHLCKPKK